MALEMTTGELQRKAANAQRLRATEGKLIEVRRENAALKNELRASEEKIAALERRFDTGPTREAAVNVSGEPTADEIELAALRLELNSVRKDYEELAKQNAMLESQIKDMQAPGEDVKQPHKTPDAAELLKTGDLASARKKISEGLSQSPEDRKFRLMLGILYCKEGNFEAAVRTLKKLVADERENVDVQAHLALGGAYMALGNYANARLELEMVIAFNPGMSEGHFNMAQLLLLADPPDPEGARQSYVEALKRGAKAEPRFEKRLSTALKQKTPDLQR
jgi:Flp pilus assembly protein TadD